MLTLAMATFTVVAHTTTSGTTTNEHAARGEGDSSAIPVVLALLPTAAIIFGGVIFFTLGKCVYDCRRCRTPGNTWGKGCRPDFPGWSRISAHQPKLHPQSAIPPIAPEQCALETTRL